MQALTIEAVDPFESYLEALPNGIIVIDAEQEIIYANNIAEHWLQPKLIGQSWLRLMKTIGVKKITDKSWRSLTNGRDIKMAVNTLSQFQGQVILLQARPVSKTRSLSRYCHIHLKRKLSRLAKRARACNGRQLLDAGVSHYQRLSLAFYDALRSVIEQGASHLHRAGHTAAQRIRLHEDGSADLIDLSQTMLAFSIKLQARLDACHSRMWVDSTGPVFKIRSKLDFDHVLNEFLALSFEYHDAVDVSLSCDYSTDQVQISLMYQGRRAEPEASVEDVRAREQDPLKAIKAFTQLHQGTLSIEGDIDSQLQVTLAVPKSPAGDIRHSAYTWLKEHCKGFKFWRTP